ncbi:MAG TPA: serine/threonine-protein kinase [Planctomycetota bacterium]
MSLTADDSARFGFASERWLEVLRTAEAPPALGRLGPYELLEEAGRGGQGVVFRARQPGTGREIAVKRLLAGSFASPQTLRRFEREVEAAIALNHPGIVTVYGVERVEGAPLLAMEWVDGVPVTRWAAQRSRAEVLRLFLLVCDAVQHAHQRGVLHRDLKPSNVLVDAAGRPRVLDFGLAKLASDSQATITASGDFLGTPAYAAPEQWRGEELDVRADVYALGTLLFEMLTGRRLVEGEGLKALLQASASVTPTRPSALLRSIPRELDAIVLQALATERPQRYQSVDALASDVRRFLAGEPVSAHPPGAWYLLRKLVARNRLVSALAAALVLAILVHAFLTARHADELAHERDRALLAGKAEAEAHALADAQRVRAEEALGVAQEQRVQAEQERETAQQMLDFIAADLVQEADPQRHGHTPSLSEVLRASAAKVDERFPDAPRIAARFHRVLGRALWQLGSFAEAETELRKALALAPDRSAFDRALDHTLLGLILHGGGKYAEAEVVLRRAIELHESCDPPDRRGLGEALAALAPVLRLSSRDEEALDVGLRVVELVSGDSRIRALGNVGVTLFQMGRLAEARPYYEEALASYIEQHGEEDASVVPLIGNLAALDAASGDRQGAVATYRRCLEIQERALGPDHPFTADTRLDLAEVLVLTGALDEGEDQVLEALEDLPEGSIEAALGQLILGNLWMERGDAAAAEPHYAAAVRAFDALGHRVNFQIAAEEWLNALVATKQHEQAETLLRRVLEVAAGRDLAWALSNLGALRSGRGDQEEARELLERAIELVATLPGEATLHADTLRAYARVLRRLGDAEGAAALEREADELRR